MTIWFCLSNHDPASQESLMDAALPMLAALNELGYEAKFTPSVMDTGVNVLFDGFSDQHVRQLLTFPVKFGIIATEWYDNGLFNGGKTVDHEARLRNFLLLANRAAFVWSLTNAPGYWTLGIPTETTLIGFQKDCFHPTNVAPYIDFIAYGEYSPERAEMIGKFRDAGLKVMWPGAKVPRKERDRMAQSGKFVLGLSPVSGISHFSTTRLASALHNGRPFVSFEPVGEVLGSVVPVIDERSAEGIVGRLEVIAKLSWRERFNDQMAVFQHHYAMTDIMKHAAKYVNLGELSR